MLDHPTSCKIEAILIFSCHRLHSPNTPIPRSFLIIVDSGLQFLGALEKVADEVFQQLSEISHESLPFGVFFSLADFAAGFGPGPSFSISFCATIVDSQEIGGIFSFRQQLSLNLRETDKRSLFPPSQRFAFVTFLLLV